MNAFKVLSRVFDSADEIPFDDASRIVLMSDCHRGDGSWSDDFLKNRNLYYAALKHYYEENYIYIEIGDGDELWKNTTLSQIIPVHIDTFTLMSQFMKEGRLHLIFGNHDIVKKGNTFATCRNFKYLDRHEQNEIFSYKNIKFHEGLILKHTVTGNKIFLVHGHQADFMNYSLWRVSRFLVRHVWRPLETFGLNDPTSTARNYRKKDLVERILTGWVIKEKQMLVAGHTHRPMFPDKGEPPYFNDGCCVHPFGITSIEIADGYITLVKWNFKTRNDRSVYVGREILAGPNKFTDYFL